MKLLINIFASFLILLPSSLFSKSSIEIKKQSYGYTIDFEVPNINLVQVDKFGLIKKSGHAGESYSRIRVPGYSKTSEVGKPELLNTSFYMAIGELDQSIEFEILNPVSEEITLNTRLFPKQEPWPKDQPISERSFSIDEKYYSTGGTKNAVASVTSQFTLRGVPCARVEVCPFSYNPSENKLTYIKKFTLKIKTPTNIKYSKLNSKVFENYLRYALVNFDHVVEPVKSISHMENYLIITGNDFESGLSDFVTFRQERFNVQMVTTSETGSSSSEIQDYIKGLNPTPPYILLVGDVDVIPVSSSDPDATDLGYADIEGDFHPEIFLGRFSVANSTDLSNIINKTIVMERELKTFDMVNLFFGGEDENNGYIAERTHNQVINDHFDAAGYDNKKYYFNSNPSITRQEVYDIYDAGSIFCIYSGHGGETGWALSFGGEEAARLNLESAISAKNNCYPFMYGFCCNSGKYTDETCFTEGYTRAEKGAAIAIGATISTGWDPDDELELGIMDAIFDDDNPQTSIGASFNAGKLNLSDWTMEQYHRAYNIMGDPALEVFPIDLSPFVQVSFPDGKEVLLWDSTYNFKWKSNLDGNVKIELYKGGVLKETLASSVENSGSFFWKIPANYTEGHDYKLKVISLKIDTCIDESDDFFSISEEVILPVPYKQDFDNFSKGMEYWTQSDNDDFDWTINSGPTETDSTGANEDHTSGDGEYIYTRAAFNNNKEAIIISPKFDFRYLNDPELTIWYHMYGSTMGDLYVDVKVGDGNWQEGIIEKKGDQGNSWNSANLDLSSITNNNKKAQFRLRVIIGYWDRSDICIDDFEISGSVGNNNAGLSPLTSYQLMYNKSHIYYFIPENRKNVQVNMKLYNIQGKQVRTLVNSVEKSGMHKINLNNNLQPLAAAVYFCKIQAGDFVKTIKVIKR